MRINVEKLQILTLTIIDLFESHVDFMIKRVDCFDAKAPLSVWIFARPVADKWAGIKIASLEPYLSADVVVRSMLAKEARVYDLNKHVGSMNDPSALLPSDYSTQTQTFHFQAEARQKVSTRSFTLHVCTLSRGERNA